MGSEAEDEPSSRPKLPLFLTIPSRDTCLPSGILTPPLQTSASVPFHWEQEPGKPRPCTDIIPLPNNTIKNLELPPRLVLIDSSSSKITKTPSPTTVLDGPDYMNKSVFSSASFRFSRKRERRQRSFDSNCSSWSPEEGGQLLGSKKEQKGKGLFGSFRLSTPKLKSGKKEVGGASSGSYVISSSPLFSSVEIAGLYSDDYEDDKGGRSASEEGKMGRRRRRRSIKRNGSFSSIPHSTRSHFWAAIYEGFKYVIPWKSRYNKKDSFTI